MPKRGRVKLGDYVLATRWNDCDPRDPWRVGFVVNVVDTWMPHPVEYLAGTKLTYVIGDENGVVTDTREYPCAKKITKTFGDNWIKMYGRKQ